MARQGLRDNNDDATDTRDSLTCIFASISLMLPVAHHKTIKTEFQNKMAQRAFSHLEQRSISHESPGQEHKHIFPEILEVPTIDGYLQEQRKPPSIQDTRRYALLLRQCGDRRDLAGIKDLHARIARSGQERNRYVANLLVQMYAKCGDVEEAQIVFAKIKNKNVFSWTLMIAAFAQNGHCARAVELFRAMDVPPEEATFIAALGACTKCGCYDRGREIHARIKECGLDSSLVLGNTLINMYGKCRALRDARVVFDRMPERSTVSWNAIIGAYAQNSQHREALELFREMITRAPGGIVPDEVTFLPVLQSCSGLQDLVEGEAIHDLAAKLGLESNVVIANALINMYGKCGRIAKARDLFDRMKRRSIVSLNTIISAYALNGCGFQAIDLYKKMAELEQQNFQPNDITFVVLLDACGSVSSLEIGLELHREIASRGLESRINVQNALINIDVISWTAMITALAQNSREEEAVGLFREMELEGVKANDVTLAALATAFVNLGNFGDGCHIYPRVAALGMKLDVVLGTVLIGLHGICGEDVVTASKIFEQIEHSKKNVISWNAMIAVYAQSGKNSEALELFRAMDVRPNEASIASLLLGSLTSVDHLDLIREETRIHSLEGNPIAATALVSAYGRAGSIDGARAAMERIPCGERDLVSWNAMVAACSQNGAGEEALDLYHRMNLEGAVRASEITYSSVLIACPSLRALRSIHHTVASAGFLDDLGVANSLTSAYGRFGEVDRAKEIFDAMRTVSVVSWTAIIASYAQNGRVRESLELFLGMALDGIHPSEATFTSILYACSHAGKIEEAWRCFASIHGDFGMEANEENYRCVVDLLGRAGKLEEARDLVQSMPFPADGVAWTTLLASCKTHDREEEGRDAAREMIALEPDNGASYVMLSSIIPLH
ncbi:pentatricopeptide repeat-containing protein At3g63370, chloroplastic-like [Selaginella moellendorffii]|uniref:pentatricopeptide repeat-containing protein At3g63370, chloroplastic-like n=1 Tax=Selaginella moellendorffii TaxID=88036 RepID=UPI000D1C687C|nr:pentatricopeptide repeat-containing protein At3g63370, chloroplastic-like [Selaginella moellendorffii]|eukprot:XP_024544786.1 pentatricopeptide repeat-containing protein At3g63370, chloroplastic-like [Selaginella moellendorffii]